MADSAKSQHASTIAKRTYNSAMNDMIVALQDPRCYPHPVTALRLIETHISWVFLTGGFAYKIKKPLKLDFLDFSTLERRREYCVQELHLNRRLAPQIYLGVVPITGSADAPKIDGSGEAFEYALKMREFPQESLLTNKLAQGEVSPPHIDAISDTLVSFHERASSADAQGRFATDAMVLAVALDNFAAIERLLTGNGMHLRITALKRWTHERHARLLDAFADRRNRGRIRECHGDLHSGNIALIDDAPAIFDCIEFNADFRWIDVMSEIAFLVMDLAARGRTDFAYRLLNRYLEASGDYAGLPVLAYYLVYRAMVRAKIDCIRARQPDLPREAGAREWQDFIARIALAEGYARQQPRLLAITCGLSGSGKSTAALHAASRSAMIRIRSDVERKRLFGLRAGDASHSNLDSGIYATGASTRVYERLAALAQDAIEAGFAVIVDAAFLRREVRSRFRNLATSLGARFMIIKCSASSDTLRARIDARRVSGNDPSEASLEVLERQQRIFETLDDTEHPAALEVDVADPSSLAHMLRALDTGRV